MSISRTLCTFLHENIFFSIVTEQDLNPGIQGSPFLLSSHHSSTPPQQSFTITYLLAISQTSHPLAHAILGILVSACPPNERMNLCPPCQAVETLISFPQRRGVTSSSILFQHFVHTFRKTCILLCGIYSFMGLSLNNSLPAPSGRTGSLSLQHRQNSGGREGVLQTPGACLWVCRGSWPLGTPLGLFSLVPPERDQGHTSLCSSQRSPADWTNKSLEFNDGRERVAGALDSKLGI